MYRFAALLLVLFTASPLHAQDNETAQASFGGDQFLAGDQVTQTEATPGDIFTAGDTIRIDAATGGSLHAVGRNITISAPVGVNVYIAGQYLSVDAPVKGNATLFGQYLNVEGPVAGNVRAVGQNVEIKAEVAGSAMIAGEDVELNAPVLGDAMVAGENVRFGSAARVDGTLTIYHEDPDSVDVPSSVAPADRIERVMAESDQAWVRHGTEFVRPSFTRGVLGWIGSVVTLAVAAVIFAALFPNFLADARQATLARPFRTLWIGFLVLSALIGSILMFALTGIGLLLVPLSIVLALLAGFLGYVIAAYILGVAALSLAGRGTPENFGERAIAAVAGAVIASVLVLAPFVGWRVTLALVWAGAGALAVRLIGPGFFTGPETE